MTEKELERLIRRLGRKLRDGDLADFEDELHRNASGEVLRAVRSHKVLTRGNASIRSTAADLVDSLIDAHLPSDAVAEFRRYIALSLEVSRLKDLVRAEFELERRKLPKLSLRQLVAVSDRTFDRAFDRAKEFRDAIDPDNAVGENERLMHETSGYANDVIFAVLRVLNECAGDAAERDLKRPDAMEKAIAPFQELTRLAGLLNGLDYILDSASFGEFAVEAHDAGERRFDLSFADARRTLIRQLALRRRLVKLKTGRQHARLVRERLKAIQGAFLADAVDQYLARARMRIGPDATLDALRALERRGDILLRCIDAEDDLILLSGRDGSRVPMLYHVSMALRWMAMAGALVADALPGRARREFEDDVRLDDILDGLRDTEQHDGARSAWEELTVGLPARTHFDLVRKPFVRTSAGRAQPIRAADAGLWSTVVRETVNVGGEVGRLYGSIWEEFCASGFVDTGWDIVGRNVSISDGRCKLTEIDMLLVRDDLLLAVELKALTGSGVSPHDHWKNRMVVEKGCRQALLAATTLRNRTGLLPSIVGRKVADRIRVIQPLVLTSEAMFDGWSHLDVPVAGETIRKAITTGTKVEFYYGDTREVVRTDTYLRPEDLDTDTILRALREPVELRIAPERGKVVALSVTIGGVTFHVPNLVPD